MENLEWKEVKWFEIKTYQLGEEPEIFHVIPSGNPGLYIVLHDDAYEIDRGKVEFFNKEELEEKYKIKL